MTCSLFSLAILTTYITLRRDPVNHLHFRCSLRRVSFHYFLDLVNFLYFLNLRNLSRKECSNSEEIGPLFLSLLP